jgi:shikimate kinase
MNIVIAGPCGVGKSTIAQSFAQRNGLVFLDLDDIREEDISNRKYGFSPCSASKLNLRECLPSVLHALAEEFVLDIGGDTVFRPDADNDERRQQVLWLKRSYSAFLLVLTAGKESLFQRFSTGKNRDLSEFEALWLDWKTIGEPNWFGCADLVIDTTDKTINESVDEIGKAIKSAGGNYS